MADIVKVKQIRSITGRPEKHRRIVQGLGLRRINHVRELIDTPNVRGMITKVQHLVEVVD